MPGMHMDEGWSIVSSRGEWPAANPLSGLTIYSGPFPRLLLFLLGNQHGLLVLRGCSVLANGAMLVLIARMCRRVYPARLASAWTLLLVGTLPVFLVTLRTGIEVLMLMPCLTVLGLYLLTLRTRRAAFGAGLTWGLLVYNHLIGAAFPIGIALAWLVAYRRWPPVALVPFVGGLALGLLPRGIALALYGTDLGTGTSAERYDLHRAIADLSWLPKAMWETWTGKTVYLRYCGRVAVHIWPYWALGLGFLAPWWRRPSELPRAAVFCLSAALACAVMCTILAPYLAVRFFVLPLVAACAGLGLLAAGAGERDARWRNPVAALALLLTGCNLFYLVANFYLPWADGDLGITTFFLGRRSAATSSWGYLPKQDLVRAVLARSPRPEQVIASPSLDRPLRAMLHGSGISSAIPAEADRSRSSVFIDYAIGKPTPERCVDTQGERRCFHSPEIVARYFVVYR